MDNKQTLEHLRRCKHTLVEQFGVRSLALFGSVARGEANAKRYFGVLFYLEDELGTSVDLATETALKEELKPFIVRDLIYV